MRTCNMTSGLDPNAILAVEDVVDDETLTALRQAVGIPLKYMPPVTMTGARPLPNVGPLVAQGVTLKGLSMPAPNPQYEAARDRYIDLVRQMQFDERAALEAKTWRANTERVPYMGCWSAVSLRDDLMRTEMDVLKLMETGLAIDKPPAIRDDLNADIRKELNEAVGKVDLAAIVTEFETEERKKATGDPDKAAAAVKARINAVAVNVTREFRTAIDRYDWAENPLTEKRLEEEFATYMKQRFGVVAEALRTQRKDSPVRPTPITREPANDTERYTRDVVTVSVVPQYIEWFEPIVFEADDLTSAELERAKKILERETMLLVYPSSEARDESVQAGDEFKYAYPDVRMRGEQLRTNDARNTLLQAAISDTIRLQLYIEGFGTLPSEWSEMSLAELRMLQHEKRMAVSPTEESLQTRRVRLLDAIEGLRAELEVRLARARYELQKIGNPIIQVPLVIARDVYESRPATLRVEVVDADKNIPADATYTWTWYKDGEPIDGAASETYTIESDAGREGGEYFAKVVIGETTTLYSHVATVHVWATCRRCTGTRFDVGTERVFGECTWRAHPSERTNMDIEPRKAARPREQKPSQYIVTPSDDQSAAVMGFTTNRHEYSAPLDDSIRNESNELIVSDRDLAHLGTLTRGQLEQRYFTYEAILANMASRRGGVDALRAEVIAAINSPSDSLLHLFRVFGIELTPVVRAAAVAAAGSARHVAALPLLGVFAAVLLGTDVATASETRYFGTLQGSMLYFTQLARLDMTFDEGDEATDTFIATMTASDVRSSMAWDNHYTRAPAHVSRTLMFVDTAGYTRLRSRLDHVRVRFDALDRFYRDVETCYSNEQTVFKLSVEHDTARDRAIGVPLRTWQIAEFQQDLARERKRGRTCMTPAHAADWTGVHSFKTDQPTRYAVTFDDVTITETIRGSERLNAGYDFPGLHRAIDAAIAEHNKNPSRTTRKRIESLVRYFNVLAQYAPVAHMPALPMRAIIPDGQPRRHDVVVPAAELIATLDAKFM